MQGQGSSLAGFTFDIHPEVISLKNTVHNGKPEAGAGGFGGEEGVKNGFKFLRGHPAAVIGNFDTGTFAF